MALKKPWVGWTYQAPFTNNSRGIAILIAKTAHFHLHNLRSDQQGRFLFLHVTVDGLETLLLAFYVPPPFQFTVLREGLAFMSEHPTLPAVWMGDFNMVIDPLLDRLPPPNTPQNRPSRTRFGRFLSEFALSDTWRLKHPTTPAYSCFTPSQNAMSRIDMIILTPTLIPNLLSVGFGARVLSDHSPYWITLQLPSSPPSRLWRLNPFWLATLTDVEIIQREWSFYFQSNQGSASLRMVWEAFKSHARLTLSTHINRHKASSNNILQQAEEHLGSLEQAFLANPTPTNSTQLRLQSRLTDHLHFEKAKKGIFFSKQRIFEHGEHAGRLLAYMTHLDHTPPVVVQLCLQDGTVLTDPEQVAHEFRRFYADLYTSRANRPLDELHLLLDNIDFPSLSATQVELLEAPITE